MSETIAEAIAWLDGWADGADAAEFRARVSAAITQIADWIEEADRRLVDIDEQIGRMAPGD